MAQYRLDRLLAEAAGIPRAEARRAILKGQVALDGAVCRRPDQKAQDTAALALAGRPLRWQKYVYLMLDKPQGVVSASRDGRDTTVADLVRAQYPRRELFPAGRLDKDSTGFVLLTDDGAFAHAILSPRRHVPKTYRVELDTPVTPAMVTAFAQGVTLADGQAMKPADLIPDPENPLAATVVLHQGVYHQIKRMFGVLDAGVNELHRQAIGGLALDPALAPGQWRPITEEELARLAPGGQNA
ncbi:pseudouridine synthase [Candidatus Allofournierella excrementavium]|uniref:pseudouridine synthase n=1 Tax=Candidatus Allofournierella excrementavium TaxID=2838591 RepID=UPI003AF51B29